MSPMSYPAENILPSPVMITQRVSIPFASAGICSAIASRMAWSSALRLSGLEMVSRATASAGRSTLISPGIAREALALLQDDERVALAHGLAFLDLDLLDDAGVLGLDRHLHLHG